MQHAHQSRDVHIVAKSTHAEQLVPDPCLHARAMPHAKTSTLDPSLAIRIWNTLPDTVVGKIKSDSVQSFKQRV